MHGVLPAGAQRAMFPGVRSDTESLDRAKSGAEQSSGVTGDTERSGWFGQLARKLWPKKTATILELYTGVPLSTCHRWCRGSHDITGSALRDLLRGEEGGSVLAVLLVGCKAKWVLDFKRGQQALGFLQQQKEQWQQLELTFE